MKRSEDATGRKRVLVFGASGTIGSAVVRQLVSEGRDVTAVFREARRADGYSSRACDVTSAISVKKDAFAGDHFDVVISCLASRTGAPKDAQAIDYQANANILAAAQDMGVPHMILLSAICVQKPQLAFQHAKLAFERELMASGLDWTIVRPTAFFKSLSGQVERVRRGKPYLLFGDGKLTRCKPISDADLARFISVCVDDADRRNAVLPIGGSGPAISPLEQGEHFFALTNRQPRYRRIPVRMINAAIGVLSALGKLSSRAANAAEYARIARYYATESMLVWDAENGRYDAEATPEFGSETLFDHYAALLRNP